jgi:hypothetical protein
MNRWAVLDSARVYRYALWRDWTGELLGGEPFRPLCVIGLNPSTADALKDDPTIRRCVDFARRLGCNALEMVNLFAYRSTDPKVLAKLTKEEAIGPENDEMLHQAASRAHHIVAAWGNRGDLFGRDDEVLYLLRRYQVDCFGRTKDGSPKHPLYLPRTARLVSLQAELREPPMDVEVGP